LVVQPGVEFGDQIVHPYDRHKASELSKQIVHFENLVYEAHSTDYQTPLALKQLVEDHFAILKVGPALTFAYREAVFALSWIEAEWLSNRPGIKLSNLPETLVRAMQAQPAHWRNFYQGSTEEVCLALKYSYSDRSRYYWTHPDVQGALSKLYENLAAHPPPLSLVSQFMPEQYHRLRAGRLPRQPLAWVRDRIADVLQPYLRACGWNQETS
jgi:D-tagatose-1,6-bisphosphate aldolase subunit GatZ/KbaZ